MQSLLLSFYTKVQFILSDFRTDCLHILNLFQSFLLSIAADFNRLPHIYCQLSELREGIVFAPQTRSIILSLHTEKGGDRFTAITGCPCTEGL